MLYDGINLDEGTEIFNTSVASGGGAFPLVPNIGELFFKTAPQEDFGLWVHDGAIWNRLGFGDCCETITDNTSFPKKPKIGDVFYLNSNDVNEGTYFWDGENWILIESFDPTVDPTDPNKPPFPKNPKIGDVFYLNSNDVNEGTYFWDGDTWVLIESHGPGAEAKKRIFSGPQFPNNAIVGHTFYLTAGDKGAYILTPNGWKRIDADSITGFTYYRYRSTTTDNAVFRGEDIEGKVLKFTTNNVLVFVNGSNLQPGEDYTLDIINSTVTLIKPRGVGDEVHIVVFDKSGADAIGGECTDASGLATMAFYSFIANPSNTQNFFGADTDGNELILVDENVLVNIDGVPTSAFTLDVDNSVLVLATPVTFGVRVDIATFKLADTQHCASGQPTVVFYNFTATGGTTQHFSGVDSTGKELKFTGENVLVNVAGVPLKETAFTVDSTTGVVSLLSPVPIGTEVSIAVINLTSTENCPTDTETMSFYRFIAITGPQQDFLGTDEDGTELLLVDENIFVNVNDVPVDAAEISVDLPTSTVTITHPCLAGDVVTIAAFKLPGVICSGGAGGGLGGGAGFQGRPSGGEGGGFSGFSLDFSEPPGEPVVPVNQVKLISDAGAYNVSNEDVSSLLRFTKAREIIFSTPGALNILPGGTFEIEQVSNNNLIFTQENNAKIVGKAQLKTSAPHSVVKFTAINDTDWLASGDLVPETGITEFEFTGETAMLAPRWANTFVRLSGTFSPVPQILTLSLPDSVSASFPIGAKIKLQNLTSVEIAIDSGVSVVVESSKSTTMASRKFCIATLVKVSDTTWSLYGDLLP